MKFRLWPVAALAILAGFAAFAQTPQPRALDHNLNTWWNYAGEHPIAGGWNLISEAEIRRAGFLRSWQQLVFREAAAYRFSPHVLAAAGYFWTRTARYGDYPADRAILEHRAFEQLSVHHSIRHVDFDQRFRIEQRWFEDFSRGEPRFWRFQERTRYQIRLALPFGDGGRRYLFAGDEIFFHFGPNHGAHALNQNRVQAGIGYRLTHNNRVEVGYLNQYVLQQNGFVNESNHTLRFQFLSSVPLFGRR